ncbi:DUF2200 family protein [Polaribacter sp.]|nr:DUF2200 family protein [Polaribacter sp.]
MFWLKGYKQKSLDSQIQKKVGFETFFCRGTSYVPKHNKKLKV